MSWLRRLSRDRSSKADPDISMPVRTYSNTVDSPTTTNQPYKDTQYSSGFNSADKIGGSNYRPSTAGEPGYVNVQHQPRALVPTGSQANDAMDRRAVSQQGTTMEPAPDPLTKAFNEAIRPYQEQIEDLRAEIEEKTYQLEKLEDERADMHAWIDKRGLRADIPPSIAQAMNTDPTSAQTLSYQLDRKMTVLNHDLHRLQDSLSTHLPTATFASTLSALIPSIEDLAALPNGPPLAYELLIKLGGNLNSHGGDEGWNNEADAVSRADFYGRLDDCMVDVVKMRLEGEGVGGGGGGDKWDARVQVRRLEKTGAFLRSKLGLQQYFPKSAEILKRASEREGRGSGGSGGVVLGSVEGRVSGAQHSAGPVSGPVTGRDV